MADDETTFEEELPAADEATSEDAVASQKGVGKAAATAAMSTLLAASLVGALSEPPNTDQMILPEPTPIVLVLQDEEPEEPVPEPDTDADEQNARWKRLLKLLRWLLIAALLVAMLVFGALKGCASCSAGLLLPEGDEQQQEQVQPA